MADTLLLDTAAWDLVLDAHRNIAVATTPYSLAQDAASAIKTFLGECYFDTTVGVSYNTILGQSPSIALIKAQMVAAALTVPDVASGVCYISSISGRMVTGQVQVTSASGQMSVANFGTAPPPG